MSVATASTAAPVKVSRLAVFWQSQVGKKFVSAVTGVLLFLFVVGHLLGNLQAFQGAAKFNAYAQFLQKHRGLVWPTRIVMLTALILHATAGIQLYLRSREARPQPYRVPLANPATVVLEDHDLDRPAHAGLPDLPPARPHPRRRLRPLRVRARRAPT